MDRMSWFAKVYLAWGLIVCLWLSAALGLGWKMPSLSMGGAGGSSRSSGGYYPHSSWSFGK